MFHGLSVFIQRFNSVLVYQSFSFDDEEPASSRYSTVFVFGFLFLAIEIHTHEDIKQ